MLAVIEWGTVGIKVLQLIFALFILVTLHELGHFLTARWFKCRVNKFYLFFNPWFSLWKKKIGDTEYGIGWVPLGGYVAIDGMIDESMDKEHLKAPPKPHEFRSKPAWQRLIIMLAGVIVNILLAIFLFIMITYKWGEEFLPAGKLVYGVHADSLGAKMGLRNGDKLVSVDGKPVQNIVSFGPELMLNNSKNVQVIRDGQPVNVPVPQGFVRELNHNKFADFVSPRYPLYVDSVAPSAIFRKDSLKKNDRVVAFNGQPMQYWDEYNLLKRGLHDQDVDYTVQRGQDTVHVIVKLNEKGQAGFFARDPITILGTETHTYTFAQAIPVGARRCFEMLDKYVSGLKAIISHKVNANDSVGGMISIGNMFPSVWDWERFWTLTAILSIVLAFMNVLPIPALDGGHAIFIVYELITGKKPGDKFLEYAQITGMVLVLGLMAYSLGLDFWRLFR